MLWAPLRRWLGSGRPLAPDIRTLPPTVDIVYAIGDVHGCLDELLRLEAMILRDAQETPERKAAIVMLGDIIDRGPNASRTVAHVMRIGSAGLDRHVLLGNHEVGLLTFLASPRPGKSWLAVGGSATLQSYGVNALSFRSGATRVDRLAREAAASIPADHLAWLRRLPHAFVWQGYTFVHAGLRPRVPLELQRPSDLLQIREPFLSFPGSFETIVVHGHTIVVAPEHRSNRIAIDTGCYATGRLTAVRLEKDKVRFISAQRDTGSVDTRTQALI